MSFKSVIGFILLAIAIYFVYRTIQKRGEIKACNGNKVIATIIDNKCQPLNGGMCVYYPVYSYEMDGETHTYQSQCPSSTALRLGIQVPMYYNHGIRKPVESVSVAAEATMAMVFGIVAVFILGT